MVYPHSIWVLPKTQIENNIVGSASDEVVGFVPNNFDNIFVNFRENRSKHRNDTVKMKNIREDYAARNDTTNMQMSDEEETGEMHNSPSKVIKIHHFF